MKTRLTGTVIDDSTKAGVANANVFIANSMIGTASDSVGRFVLQQVTPGSYDLVASCVGYDMSVTRLNIQPGEQSHLAISLRPKAIELPVVEVEARKSIHRAEDMNLFRRALLGSTEEADECQILNPSVIFLITGHSDQLIATADSSIVIENLALGYRLHVNIGTLKVNEGWMTTAYKTLFEELEPATSGDRRRWEKNRASAYYGSLRHFLVSLIHGNIAKQGFAAYESRRRHVSPTDKLEAVNESDLVTPSAHGYWAIWFRWFLVVDYFLEQRDWEYDAAAKRGGVIQKKRPKSSVLGMEQVRVLMDPRGRILTDLPFRISGDWANEGLAKELPLEYKPPAR